MSRGQGRVSVAVADTLTWTESLGGVRRLAGVQPQESHAEQVLLPFRVLLVCTEIGKHQAIRVRQIGGRPGVQPVWSILRLCS